jgi:hypothetical protein
MRCGALAARPSAGPPPSEKPMIEARAMPSASRRISNQVRRRIVLRIGRRVGQAVAALIVNDDAETLAQGADLVKPHALAAGEAVDEDHWLARADIVERNTEIANLHSTHWL